MNLRKDGTLQRYRELSHKTSHGQKLLTVLVTLYPVISDPIGNVNSKMFPSSVVQLRNLVYVNYCDNFLVNLTVTVVKLVTTYIIRLSDGGVRYIFLQHLLSVPSLYEVCFTATVTVLTDR